METSLERPASTAVVDRKVTAFEATRDAVEERLTTLPEHELVSHFVSMFSRFEYALKDAGFFKRPKKPKERTRAEPHWDKFAKNLTPGLRDLAHPSVKEAIDYFDKRPPKKQVIVGDALGWEDRQARKHSDSDLLMLVRQVRNNLFHGGKPHVGARSQELLRHSETLMIAALSSNDDVRKSFLKKKLNATA